MVLSNLLKRVGTSFFIIIVVFLICFYPKYIDIDLIMLLCFFELFLLVKRDKPWFVSLIILCFYMSFILVCVYGVHAIRVHNPYILFLIFIVSWFHDTGGYVFGKTFGGPKLFPVVSPNKTWVGLLGGIVLGIIGIFILERSGFPFTLSYFDIIIMNIFGLLGDLLESSIKRYYNAKDSGFLLPGHGGFLDRFDSFWGIIFYFYYLKGWLCLLKI